MINGYCECHGHLMMDGSDFTAAKKTHAGGIREDVIRQELSDLRDAGVVYFRDGGDALGVGTRAREIAPEYGIEYVTPAFAIHRKGRYGWIVGRGFETIPEYRQRITEVGELRGDFVKIIVSGIITFREYGDLSCPGLTSGEIREMIHIAHEEGYAVMIHVNGAENIRCCVEAGADSIEHAYFADGETLECIAEHDTIWVPTLSAVEAFIGRDGFDEGIARETLDHQTDAVRLVSGRRTGRSRSRGIIASGSDSGAVGVPHGAGTVREYELLARGGAAEADIAAANERIRSIFRKS